MKFSFATNFLLLSHVVVEAWTNHDFAFSYRAPTPLRMEIDDVEDFSSSGRSTSSSSSRRQWLTGIASSVTATVAATASSSGAQAADLITTASVCDPSVSVWKYNDRIIYILGSAHISSQSAETAGQLVRDIHPDAVFVELDLKRVGASSNLGKKMTSSLEGGGGSSIAILPGKRISSDAASSSSGDEEESSSSSLQVATVKSQQVASPSSGSGVSQSNNDSGSGGGMMALGAKAVGAGIRGMYKNLDSAGFNAGGEFITAVEEGRKEGASIVLGDQDVDITLRRLAMALRQTDLKALADPDNELEQSLQQLMPSANAQKALGGDVSYKEELSAYVETMKAKENVRLIMSQLKKVAPALYQVMVAERDAFMAAGLNSLNDFECIVAVMGIAHVDGVEDNLRSNGWKQLNLKCSAI